MAAADCCATSAATLVVPVMTTRNIAQFFSPRSVAVVGATSRAGAVGSVLVRNILSGRLDAPVYAVNPARSHVHALPAWPDVASLPEVPELAIIATLPATIPGIVSELGEKGTRAAIVISAGFSEGGSAAGRDLQQAMLDAAQPHILRIIGPNCLGVMAPHAGLDATFARAAPASGGLAFVTQSGAVATAVVDWAADRNIGFSHVVSLGGMADVDFGDLLDYLATDRLSRAVLLYVEAVTDARKFMSAARAASRVKPVIVIKAGRFPESAEAAASHTGALAGADAVYDTAFRRAGLLRVTSLDQLFTAAETIGRLAEPKGSSLAILTNGGGAGVLAVDSLIQRGGALAALGDETFAKLDAVLPPTWPKANPIDIIGDADESRYRASLEIVMGDPAVDAVLVMNCPTGISQGTGIADAVIGVIGVPPAKPVLTNWLGGGSAEPSRQLFARHGVPTYATPDDAIEAFSFVDRYRKAQFDLYEVPPSIPEDFTVDTETTRRIFDTVISEGRQMLNGAEAGDVLAGYGIPTARQTVALGLEDIATAAASLPGPWVLKILSKEISHKSDVGGVVIGLETPDRLAAAADAMLARVAAERPDARVDGFLVQEMVRMKDARELIVGINEDPQFGPIILFGAGGTSVEIVADTALALPPLNMMLARELIGQTRVHDLLKGYRDRPPVDLDAVALTLIKVAQLAIDFGELKELDINPLLAGPGGVVALDARIRVDSYGGHPHRRLAIKPYPSELEQQIDLPDGRSFLLRPIRGEDEPQLSAGFGRLTPEEVRFRFFVPMKTLTHTVASRLSQINYDREMALILTQPGRPGTTEIFGVARLAADPNNESAEYALIVRSDLTGLGLGTRMLKTILDYARKRGIAVVHGNVLRENCRMLKLCDELGFRIENVPAEPEIVRTSLVLKGTAP